MAVGMLEYFGLSIDEFFSMLCKEEIGRRELSKLKYLRKKEINTGLLIIVMRANGGIGWSCLSFFFG